MVLLYSARFSRRIVTRPGSQSKFEDVFPVRAGVTFVPKPRRVQQIRMIRHLVMWSNPSGLLGRKERLSKIPRPHPRDRSHQAEPASSFDQSGTFKLTPIDIRLELYLFG